MTCVSNNNYTARRLRMYLRVLQPRLKLYIYTRFETLEMIVFVPGLYKHFYAFVITFLIYLLWVQEITKYLASRLPIHFDLTITQLSN